MANNKALVVGGAAVLAMFLFSGKAKADEPAPPPEPEPDDPVDPKPEPDPEPVDPLPPPVVDPTDNWGLTPPALIPVFTLAEQASGIAGIGRFLSIKSWQAARAGQSILGPAEAAAWAASHPELCRQCVNESASEIKASMASIERNTLPKGQTGPNGGKGSHTKPWPKPKYMSEWAQIGSAGLFDFLAGTFIYSGIHQGFTPFVDAHADVMFDVKAQCFAAGWFAYRVMSGSLPLFGRAQGDPVKLWGGLAQCWASPQSFLDGKTEATERFKERAKEIGIDMAKIAYPSYAAKDFPGAKPFYQALGV